MAQKKEKKTLFIIGAGCSKNFNSSENGIDGLECPINSDFFKMAKRALLSSIIEENSKPPLKNLFDQICNERGLINNNQYEFLDDPSLIDLEDVMTEIDTRGSLFENRFSARDNKHPYNVLVELIAFTLTLAIRGPMPCPLHKEIASLINEGDIIFDFNYDLLMDDALKAEGKLNDWSYNVNFFRTLDGKTWKWPSGEDVSINFFKLHGSLNWLKCVECSSIFKDETRYKFDMFTINHISKNIHCPVCGGNCDSIVRLIIPPVQTKEYNMDPYRLLWRRAALTAEKIDRIAFLGYSFGNTDFATKSLLRQICQSSSIENLKIHFMDISSDPEERFKKFFPQIRTPTRTKSLKQFIEFYPTWR
jgi:hypothetical protein